MPWWHDLKNYIQKSGVEDPNTGRERTIWEMFDDVFFNDAVDILYFWLGIFTHLYFFLAAFLYIGALSSVDTVASKLVGALAEPYLGAVGIYTILKEARKRNTKYARPRHHGEVYVIGWLVLLVVSSVLAIFLDAYTFNKSLELIITIALSVGLIYLGGVVHRP